MRFNRFSWLAWAVCTTAMAPLSGQSGTAPRVVLVELFTSEGCSSCPAADALLRRLNGTHNDQGQLFVGISEHVTYWNQLGWVDPFSDETYTARQNGYSEHFRLDEVYTPQVVVNGEAQVVGSDGNAILKAVTKLGPPTPVAVHIDSVADSEAGPKRTLTFTFSVAGLTANGADVYAVIADDIAQSSVQRGENSGRTLSHVSVARSFNKVATLKDAKTVTVSLAVPGVVKGQPETKRHLILFAQEKGQGKVLAVESKAL
jgi:hypothetical protein